MYAVPDFYDRKVATIAYIDDGWDNETESTVPLTGKLKADAQAKYGEDVVYIREASAYWGTVDCCSGGFQNFSLLTDKFAYVKTYQDLPELFADLAPETRP